MDHYNQIDSLVTQVIGTTNFLKKVIFGRTVALSAAVVFGFFLIAAIATK